MTSSSPVPGEEGRERMSPTDVAIKMRAMGEAAFELQLRHLPELTALERRIEHEIKAGRR